MASRKLTDALVERLTPEDGEWYFDTEKPGLGVRVRAGGSRTYFLTYGTGARGGTKRLILGRHGAPAPADPRTKEARQWCVRVAREEADRKLGNVREGADPAAERSAARQRPTLWELLLRVLREHCFLHKAPRSAIEDVGLSSRIVFRDSRAGKDARTWRRSLAVEYRGGAAANIAPKESALSEMGRLRADRLSESDVLRMHADEKGSPFEANRRVALLSLALNMAERWGIRPRGSNPCKAVRRYREDRRERFFSPAELAALGDALRKAEKAKTREAGRIDPFAAAAIRTLLFTGARASEVLQAKWDDVDLEAGTLRVERPKEGRPKLVHLPAPARALLADLPRLKGNPHVFPGRKTKGREAAPLAEIQHAWGRVVGLAGIEGARLHDARHSFASVLAGGGESLLLIGSLLGHREPRTTLRYSHLGADPRAAAAERAGKTIVTALDAGVKGAKAKRDNVAPLRRRAR